MRHRVWRSGCASKLVLRAGIASPGRKTKTGIWGVRRGSRVAASLEPPVGLVVFLGRIIESWDGGGCELVFFGEVLGIGRFYVKSCSVLLAGILTMG